MKIIKKQLILNSHEYYITHLSLINPLLPIKLTPKEIEVLAIFMSFSGELELDRFGTTGKALVRERLDLSHPGLANYMKSLLTKGFVQKENNRLKILPILHPEKSSQLYQIQLVNRQEYDKIKST